MYGRDPGSKPAMTMALALLLLMLGILANYHYATLTLNDLALLTNRLN